MSGFNDDEFEYRETTTMGADGEIHAVMVRLRKPREPGPMPELPVMEPCRRNCPDGECYCAEPLVSDFLFPDGEEY